MVENVSTTTNWVHTAGIELKKAIPSNLTEGTTFIIPSLEDLLKGERAILLSKPTDSNESCELQIRIFPRFRIYTISLVCSASKIELFVGIEQEYIKTINGSLLEGSVACNDADTDLSIITPPSYRYDIQIEKLCTVEILLKLITPLDEVCIYGACLQIAPNPNGIAMLLQRSMNLDGIGQIFNNSNLITDTQYEEQIKPNQKQQKPQSQSLSVPIDEESQNKFFMNNEYELIDRIQDSLKAHIDNRFEQLEIKLMKRVQILETQQTAKLDKILEMLQKDQKDLQQEVPEA